MNRWNVRFLFCLGLFAGVAWGQNKELNTITSVEIHGGRVEIIGTKQPSFTSFTMTDPARLVIDIAEAVFSGVPDQIPGSGAVSWIKTASYGADTSAIARVLIGFSQDVETDVASPGNKLVIKILNSNPPAVARTDRPAGTAQKESTAEKPKDVGSSASPQLANPTAAEAAVSDEAARKKQESKAKETAQKAEQERLAQEQAQKEAAKRAEQERLEEARRAEVEKKRQAEEESKRLAEQERIAEKQRRIEAEEAKRQAAAEQRQKAEEEQLAREKAKQEAEQAKREAAAEQKRIAEEERQAKATARAQAESAKGETTADQKRSGEEDRLAQASARAEAESAKREATANQKRNAEEERLARESARAEAESAKREAAAEQKRKAEEERRTRKKSIQEAQNAERLAAAERKRQAQEQRVATAKARQEALAAEREAKSAARSGSKAATGASKRRTTMTFVGFERAASGARVYVRTNGPVHYTVQQEGDKKVVLELENTRIGTRNSRRPLDTSFFDTAVAMVSPNPAGNRTVRVEISLKEAVSFQTKQDGNEVSVEFPRASRR
jgi:hypothetical protein